MFLFLLMFLSIYGGLHLYVYARMMKAIHLPIWGSVMVALFFIVMIVSPIMIRFFEKSGHDSAARVAAFTGYSWLGFVFFFFCVLLCIDLIRLAMYTAGIVSGTGFACTISSYRTWFYVGLVISVLITLYGYREAAQVRPHSITIQTEKLPAGTDAITIAQVSDVHLGLIVGETKVKKIIEIIDAAKPDILVSTGDLVDADIDGLQRFASLLAPVKPHYGKYAITGNHEFYAGINSAMEFHRRAGFQVLRNRYSSAGPLNIAGVDDPAGGRSNVSEKTLLSMTENSLFTILLKHRPIVDTEAASIFDLQLSGHTHKGQIYPFRYLTRLAFQRYSGYYALSGKSHLYVSRGTGTWGPPIRFLSPPEVTIIQLVRVKP